jgi:hypothetical protein
MIEALEELRHGRDVNKIAEMGVSWAEFNDIVGLNNWRKKEIQALSDEELIQIYGTSNLSKIIEKELKDTQAWEK